MVSWDLVDILLPDTLSSSNVTTTRCKKCRLYSLLYLRHLRGPHDTPLPAPNSRGGGQRSGCHPPQLGLDSSTACAPLRHQVDGRALDFSGHLLHSRTHARKVVLSAFGPVARIRLSKYNVNDARAGGRRKAGQQPLGGVQPDLLRCSEKRFTSALQSPRKDPSSRTRQIRLNRSTI